MRNLSKILATTSQTVRPSPASNRLESAGVKQQEQDDFEDELSPEQPTFTIAVDNDEENDSSLMDRPRLSMPIVDVDETLKSVEVPRKASFGLQQERMSRGSFGSLRESDKFALLKDLKLDNSHSHLENDQQWQEIDDEVKYNAAVELG